MHTTKRATGTIRDIIGVCFFCSYPAAECFSDAPTTKRRKLLVLHRILMLSLDKFTLTRAFAARRGARPPPSRNNVAGFADVEKAIAEYGRKAKEVGACILRREDVWYRLVPRCIFAQQQYSGCRVRGVAGMPALLIAPCFLENVYSALLCPFPWMQQHMHTHHHCVARN